VEAAIHIDPDGAVLRRLVDEVVDTHAGMMIVRLRGVRTEKQLAKAMIRASHGGRTSDAMLPIPPRRWRSAVLMAQVDASDSGQMIRRFGWALPHLIDSWRTQGVDLTVLIQQEGVHDALLDAIEGGRRVLAMREPMPWIPGNGLVALYDDATTQNASFESDEAAIRDNLISADRMATGSSPRWGSRGSALTGVRPIAHRAGVGR